MRPSSGSISSARWNACSASGKRPRRSWATPSENTRSRSTLVFGRRVDGALEHRDHFLEARALLVVLHQQQRRLTVARGGELIEDLPGLLVAAERFEHLGLLDLEAAALELAGAGEERLLRLQDLERLARLAGLGQAVGEQEHDLAPQPVLDRARDPARADA